MKKNRVSRLVTALAAVVTFVAVAVSFCLGGSVPWREEAAQNLSAVAEARVCIILKSIEGTLAPSPDAPKEIWQTPLKTAAYYCINPTEAGKQEDFLGSIIDLSAMKERWPDQVNWKMGADEMALRSAVISLLRSPAVFKIVTEGVVKATVATTSEKTAKNRTTILQMLDAAHAYLDTVDMKAEEAWLAECKQSIAKAVEADKKSGGNDAYYAAQYRFNQFGPGKYKEGAVPSADRYIQTFVYRRLNDGMTTTEIRSAIRSVQTALTPKRPRPSFLVKEVVYTR
jgi:hypothetical protein